MRVGTRITAATSALVAATLGIYAAVDLGAAADRRRIAMEREAAGLATAVRATLETSTSAIATNLRENLSARLSRAAPGWDITIVPATAADDPPGTYTRAQIQRLAAFIEASPTHLAIVGSETFVYALPIRTPNPSLPDGFEVVGTVEVARSTANLQQAFSDDLKRTVPVLVVIVVVLIVAVMALVRRLVTRPITKLISGIDDVAQGDLSRVLLSEREDEVGALAARFNAMTTSLRDSRAETERQNSAKISLEERLSHTEKLATIGQLAAEIAHEVGTPLNVIAGRARTLAKKSADTQAVEKNANIIAEQALRITRIIQRLLEVTRRDIMTTGMADDVDLNALCRTTLEFLDGKIAAAAVTAHIVCAPDVPLVSGHADQLQQVLINLLLNAIEAMPHGGTLAIETAARTRRRPGLEHAPEQVTAIITITDSGMGIPPELRDRIFEPFYTSKQGQGGTGLGLAVSHGIIKQHDGWIEVDGDPGGGTVFRVCIPAAQPNAGDSVS